MNTQGSTTPACPGRLSATGGEPRSLAAVDVFLESLDLVPGPPGACPYLPGRQATYSAFAASRLHPEVYHELMDRGFRRSGTVFYRDRCHGCAECRPIRVPVDRFRPSRSQRRVWRKNRDLTVRVGRPVYTAAKWRLFREYQEHQHDGTMVRTVDDFRSFLYASPVHTLEVCYQLGQRLLGASIVDRSRRSLSSVYFYWSPQQASRSLGTYSILWEIDFCRRSGIPWYYLGLFVRNSKTMSYKARFRPCQIMTAAGRWVTLPPPRRPAAQVSAAPAGADLR